MEKQIIEIKGIKLEVDLREARKIESYKIGDNVRLLKKSYGDKYEVHPGVIVGFDAFEKLPTITIAYLEIGYSKAEILFAHINDNSKDEGYEIAPAHELEELTFKRTDVVAQMDAEIEKRKQEIRDMENKKNYFLKYFNQYFATEKQEAI